MFSLSKIQIRDINSLITCYICHGYLIDAVSLPDCHHSFCQSCIMKYVLNNNTCPICGLMIHKTRPELYLIPDKTLQQIVFKLVPGLLKKEIISREEFCSTSKTSADAETSKKSTLLDYSDNIAADPDTTLCLEIDLIEITKNENGNVSACQQDRRYLFLSGMFPIRLLKKFASNKFELNDRYVEICHDHSDLFLPDHFTLNDVADIINWKAESPLALKCVVWEDDDFTDGEIFDAIGSTGPEPCESTSSTDSSAAALPECPYNSFKEYREHMKKANPHTKEVPCTSKRKNIKCTKKLALHERTNLPKSAILKPLQPDNSDLPYNNPSSADRLYNTEQSHNLSASSVSISQHSCQLKLRIRAKGVADSVLILPPELNGTVDSVEEKRVVKHHNHKFSSFTTPDAESSDQCSIKPINNVFGNETSPKKFMSKKSMFFSRLSHDQSFLDGFLRDYKIDDNHQGCSEDDKNNPFLSFLHTPLRSPSSVPLSSSPVSMSLVSSSLPSVSLSLSVLPSTSTVAAPFLEPLNVSVESRVSTSTPIPGFSDGSNLKERLLLTTTSSARRKGQIWKPYSSPDKIEKEMEVLERDSIDSSTPDCVSERTSKSPVIVFNPSLPLPSFSSLLQSFSSSSSSSAVDFHDSNSNGSKIGIFISKGKSMTLEEKTKIAHDFSGSQKEERENNDTENNKVADSFLDSNLIMKQPAETENKKSKFLRGSTEGGSEAKVERKGLAFRNTNISNVNYKQFSTSRRKTPPWLGKKIEIQKIKKGTNLLCTTSFKNSLSNNDDIRSPHKKKLHLDVHVGGENPSKVGSGNDRSSSNKTERRPLSILN